MFVKKNYLLFIFVFSCFIPIQSWSQTPTLEATGNQAYCPQSSIPIVEAFNLTSGTSQVNAVFIPKKKH